MTRGNTVVAELLVKSSLDRDKVLGRHALYYYMSNLCMFLSNTGRYVPNPFSFSMWHNLACFYLVGS
jgi:hypothetical protein